MIAPHRHAGVASLLFVTVACSNAKREAMSLIAAVDRYRAAPMSAKASPEDVLEKLACTDADVCSARESCLATARPTVRGVALKQQVEAALDDLQAGRITREQASALGLSQKLDEASRAIDEGQKSLPDCDAKTNALRRKYAY